VLTQTYNFGAEAHLGARVLSAFIFQFVAIVREPASTFILSLAVQLSGKAHEDSDYIAMITVMH